jgi:hypothetical protein
MLRCRLRLLAKALSRCQGWCARRCSRGRIGMQPCRHRPILRGKPLAVSVRRLRRRYPVSRASRPRRSRRWLPRTRMPRLLQLLRLHPLHLHLLQ